MANNKYKSGDQLSSKSILIWRVLQTTVWLVGITILFNLIFFPELGIHMFWNVLIPIAPALLVVAVGIWRNVCPLASTALFSRHIGYSRRKKLSMTQTGKLNLTAMVCLFLMVPLRHAIFNLNGPATAVLIITLGIVGIMFGLRYEWKSGWCSGLCPVYPVERLYGINNRLTLPNARCHTCQRCVTPCPDSTPGIHPMSTTKTAYHKISGFLMIGAFPGFVWGWFQVQDFHGISAIHELVSIYAWPLLGMVVTSILYFSLKQVFSERTLTGIFSAAAVSCYYWYRIPALFGFGIFPGDGMLVDLTRAIPAWFITIITALLVVFFFWWINFSNQRKRSWAIRPEYSSQD